MAKVRRRFSKGVELLPEDLSSEALSREGELAYDSSDDKLKYHNASETKEIVNTDETQTLENKTIDATSASGNNTISMDSDDVVYDNTTSGLTATNVKDAIDELQTGLENQNEASELQYDNSTSGLTATNVQDAIDEVEGRLDTAETNISTNTSNLAETDQNTDDLITLSGVAENSTDLGTFTGSTISDNETIKGALQELETEVELKIEPDSTDTLTNKTINANDNTITNIANAEVAAGAAIDLNKLAALTADRALVADGSGFVSASSVTSTELGYVSGVTSSIQDQLDDKLALDEVFNIIIATGTISASNGITYFIDSSGGTNTVNLPAPSVRSFVRVKDVGGQAETNNITVNTAAGNIDGQTSYTIESNYESVTFVSDNINWYIL